VLRVGAESGLVVLDLCGRRREVLLPCDVAVRLAEAIEAAAIFAATEPAPLSRGEVWGCQVESYDGLVALRFDPPSAGSPSTVPLTPAAARWLADSIRFKEQQAEHRLRLVVRNTGRR
jgi:hypothetical protein